MRVSTTPSLDQDVSLIRRRPARNRRAILARHEVRQRAPQVHAPGFLHGDFDFDEIRTSSACQWFEQAVFVAQSLSITGRVLGWCVVRFEEGFVHVSTRLAQDDARDTLWLQSQTEQARTCVHLSVCALGGVLAHAPTPPDASTERIDMRCDAAHLYAMESAHLGVTRDHHAGAANQLDVALYNHGLSLLGLCFKLMAPSSDLGHAQAA